MSRLSYLWSFVHHKWRAEEGGQQYGKSLRVITLYLYFYHQCRNYCRDVLRNAKLARQHCCYFSTNYHFSPFKFFTKQGPELCIIKTKCKHKKTFTHLKNPTTDHFYGKDSRLNSSVGISIFSSLRCTLLLEAISVNSSIYYCGIDPLSHRPLGQKNNNSSFRATISISWEQRENESWLLLRFVKSCQTPRSKITAYNRLLVEFDISISFKEKFNDLERQSAYHKWQQKFSINRHLIFLPRGRGTNHMVSVCSPQLVFQVQCNIDRVQHMSQSTPWNNYKVSSLLHWKNNWSQTVLSVTLIQHKLLY